MTAEYTSIELDYLARCDEVWSVAWEYQLDAEWLSVRTVFCRRSDAEDHAAYLRQPDRKSKVRTRGVTVEYARLDWVAA